MIIIKPETLNGLRDIEKNLNYLFSYTNLADLGHERRVRVNLPKFVIESVSSLRHPLEKVTLGISFLEIIL